MGLLERRASRAMRARVAVRSSAADGRVADDVPDALLLALLSLVALLDRALRLGGGLLQRGDLAVELGLATGQRGQLLVDRRERVGGLGRGRVAPGVRPRGRQRARPATCRRVLPRGRSRSGRTRRVPCARSRRRSAAVLAARAAASAAFFAVAICASVTSAVSVDGVRRPGMLERAADGTGVAVHERAGQGGCLVGELAVDQVQPGVVRRRCRGCGGGRPLARPTTSAASRVASSRRPPGQLLGLRDEAGEALLLPGGGCERPGEQLGGGAPRLERGALLREAGPLLAELGGPRAAGPRALRELLALGGACGSTGLPGRQLAQRSLLHAEVADAPGECSGREPGSRPARAPARRPRRPAARHRPRRAPWRWHVPARRSRVSVEAASRCASRAVVAPARSAARPVEDERRPLPRGRRRSRRSW